MNSTVSGLIIAGGVVVIAYCAYRVMTSRKSQTPPTLPLEKATTVKIGDIVGWFKSQNLNQQTDTPFICTNLSLLNIPEEKIPSGPYVVLGSYNEKTNTLHPVKIIEMETMDPEVAALLEKSDNGLVVLS